MRYTDDPLTDLEVFSDSFLAPYAVRHSDNLGRIHGPEIQEYRTCYQRDRDRIIHSKAFRRLGYKTQVFTNDRGDNYRTRLTHSLEVSQLTRSVCTALRLNADYGETLALAHDLGHTPFGHAGQDALNHLMHGHGGFEHNCQSLRIVMTTENRYPEYPGLNLTRRTLIGMMKHRCGSFCSGVFSGDRSFADICNERDQGNPSMEAAVADICDRIAYNHHDLEDGFDSGYLHFKDMLEIPAFGEAYERSAQKYGKILGSSRESLKLKVVIREMLGEAVTDLIKTTKETLNDLRIFSLDELISLSPEQFPVKMGSEVTLKMKDVSVFLRDRLYNHPEVIKMSRRGTYIIETLFQEYVSRPSMMPLHVQKRITHAGTERTVSDYISGMTDRFAEKEYYKLKPS